MTRTPNQKAFIQTFSSFLLFRLLHPSVPIVPLFTCFVLFWGNFSRRKRENLALLIHYQRLWECIFHMSCEFTDLHDFAPGWTSGANWQLPGNFIIIFFFNWGISKDRTSRAETHSTTSCQFWKCPKWVRLKTDRAVNMLHFTKNYDDRGAVWFVSVRLCKCLLDSPLRLYSFVMQRTFVRGLMDPFAYRDGLFISSLWPMNLSLVPWW